MKTRATSIAWKPILKLSIAVLFVLYFRQLYSLNILMNRDDEGGQIIFQLKSTQINESTSADKPTALPPLEPLEQCSPEQLAIIKKQLPPDECLENKRQQHRQRCSFT